MYKALVVDDEDHVRETIKAIVDWKNLGITRIIEASDGLSAYKIILQEQPNLVIADMKMPYMDGAELLRKCAGNGLNTKYIIASGYDDYEYTHQAIKTGIIDYILKPINPEELNAAIKRALGDIRLIGSDATESKEDYGFVTEIKKYIEENYMIDIKLDMFAKKYFMTKEYLLKKFKDIYGFGIYEYVIKVRMEKAMKMLESTDLRVQEVSDKVGFKDSNYFSKAFKKHYGISPKEYREARENP